MWEPLIRRLVNAAASPKTSIVSLLAGLVLLPIKPMASQLNSTWIWKGWAAVFLVSGLILGGTSLVRPGLVRDRDAVSEDVEIKRELIALRELLATVDRTRRMEEGAQEESADLQASSLQSSPIPQALASTLQAPELDGNADGAELNGAQERILGLLAEQGRLTSEIAQLREENKTLRENNEQLSRDNRQLTQDINQLRGYQIDYQQRIERRRESLAENLAKIREFASVEDTFSLDNITLGYLGQNINFQELDAELARKNRQLTDIRGEINFLNNSFYFAIVLGLANLVIGGIYYGLDRWHQQQSEKMKEMEEKIEEAQLKIRNFSWNMANASLEKYYQRNLMEVQVIFMTSVVVMILGFLVILASLALTLSGSQTVRNSPEVSSDEQVMEGQNGDSAPSSNEETVRVYSDNSNVATIGVVAGIITNFIGATFMIVYRSTVREASRYSNSLNRINDVGIAMDILNTSVEHQDSPEILAAKVEIAKRLVESDRHPDVD